MKSPWVRALVLEASDRSYSGAVLPLLEGAGKEIVASLYLFETNDAAGPWHPVNRFAEALLRARQRGVGVRLYLNTKFRIVAKTEVGLGKYFERLLKAGAEITTLLSKRRLHDKLIVIDGRYVAEGSTNWSVSALEDNFESASIIDSPAHAKKKLERLARLALPLPQVRILDRALAPLPEIVEIPLALFEKNLLPRMVRESNERALDLYLILLGQVRAAGNPELELDLETAGRALGLPAGWDRSRTRRQVIKVLRKLARRYSLIDVEFPYGRDAKITVKEWPGEKVSVPGRLLEPGFLAQAPPGVVFLELAREILKKEGVEIASLSAKELEKRFGVGSSTFLLARRGTAKAKLV